MSENQNENIENVEKENAVAQGPTQPVEPQTQQQPAAQQPQMQTPPPQQVPPQQYYDPNLQYGQPRPIYVDPNAAYNAQPRRPIKTKKTGCMVCGIIFTILAIIMSAVTAYEYFAIYMSLEVAEQAAGIITFFAFLLVYGWFTYFPALAFAITGVSCSAVGTKSSSKGQKATSIVFLVFSIITLVSLVMLFILAFLLVGTPV